MRRTRPSRLQLLKTLIEGFCNKNQDNRRVIQEIAGVVFSSKKAANKRRHAPLVTTDSIG